MGSFDKSYYDILNRYENVLKENITQDNQPVYYVRTGFNKYRPAEEADLASGSAEIFVQNPNAAQRMVYPYIKLDNTKTNNTQQNQPSISVTGKDSSETAVTTTGGNRVQYPTVDTTQTPNQQFYNSVMQQAKKTEPNTQQTSSTPTTKPASTSSQSAPATKATTTKIQPKPASKAVTTSVR